MTGKAAATPAATVAKAEHGHQVEEEQKTEEQQQKQEKQPIEGQLRSFIFTPADEEKPVLLARLPDELLMFIVTLVAAPRGQRGMKIVRNNNVNINTNTNNAVRVASSTTDEASSSSYIHSPPNTQTSLETAMSTLTVDADKEKEDGVNAQDLAGYENVFQSATSALSNTDFKHPSTHAATSEAQQQSNRLTGIGMVLGGADYVSIDHLAKTCCKFNTMTQARGVWKTIVHGTYIPPQLPAWLSLPALVKDHYQDDWRTTFIRQPRVRMNGAYIAAYEYTRSVPHPENVWVRVDHQIKYYRTLRFLPDGHVLSLLTTDPPSETLRKMEPSLRLKGFAVGRWNVHPEGLPEDEIFLRPHGAKVVVRDLNDKTFPGYTFQLVLKLDMRKGRWDRMEILEYESINLNTGEICPFPMNHKTPFYFSVVRSYGI